MLIRYAEGFFSELICSPLTDDQGAQKPHEFKNASFAIPTPCEYCKVRVGGLCGSKIYRLI